MAARQKTLDLDIRIKVGFFKHHKTQKLRRAVGAEGVLALLELMCWVRSNRHKGKLDGMTDEDIEIAAGWMGAPGALASALIVTEWIDGEAGAREIHEWKEHQAYSFHADKRVAIAKKGAKARHAKGYGASKQHAGSKQEASRQHAPSQPSYSLSSPAPIAGEEKSAGASLGALEGPPAAPREAIPEPSPQAPPAPGAVVPAHAMPGFDLRPGETFADRLARIRADKAAAEAERERNLAAIRANGGRIPKRPAAPPPSNGSAA